MCDRVGRSVCGAFNGRRDVCGNQRGVCEDACERVSGSVNNSVYEHSCGPCSCLLVVE